MESSITKSLRLSSTQLFEYLLVAYPDASVYEKVLAEKQQATKTEGFAIEYKNHPHIKVACFTARDEMEETIIRYTQRICLHQKAFQVQLNNYSGFPPNTIYLRVQNPDPFKKLSTQLQAVANYIESCSCPPSFLKTRPYLTIAKKIPGHIYNDVLMEYSRKTFHESFLVNELVLLRKDNLNDTSKKLHLFRLQPSTVSFKENSFLEPEIF